MLKIGDKSAVGDFRPGNRGDIDYISQDGRIAVQFPSSIAGRRGLYNTLMQLAMFLSSNPAVERGCLVLHTPRMSSPRIKDEWTTAKGLFAKTISERLALVVIEEDDFWQLPDDSLTRDIAKTFASTVDVEGKRHDLVFKIKQRPGQKFYEILKVLLSRWLQREAPIPLGKLAEVAGCSYPTLREAIDRKSLRHAIGFTSNRSVELKSFPHEAWNELLALSGEIRQSIHFVDRRGDKPDVESLLRRLRKLSTEQIAIGGVLAARFWHPDFDLNGTPRIDLACQTSSGEADLRFVKKLDPALAVSDDPLSSPLLVVHIIARPAPLYVERSGSHLPWSDPVETVLDLSELHLTGQANQLINFLRPEARLS